ncbi:hypothetical protein LguiA_008793 [Lonicera macranthoides]
MTMNPGNDADLGSICSKMEDMEECLINPVDIGKEVALDVNSGTRRFNAMNTEWGFPKLLQLTTFKNSDNGYLVDDCCIFGAEVFVSNPLPKGETISIINVPKTSSSFKWAIQNFSRLKQDVVTSQVFTAAGHTWYPTPRKNPESASDHVPWGILRSFADHWQARTYKLESRLKHKTVRIKIVYSL